MAAALALVAAFLFALAATLQQKGALNLPTISLADPKSLVRLVGETTWLIGTLALFIGYLFQAGALDRGRLSVIQPLLVTTVVFALPLGYFLTKQHVGRREVIGAVVIIIGLGLFVYFGDPAGGNENASNTQWAITIALLSLLSVLMLVFGSGGGLSMKAAVYGTVAGILFGLSSALTKPTLDYLHQSVGTMLSHWECYALAVAGVLGFVLQQVSLGTGRLAPSVATVSVANPLVGILIGILLLDERLSRPTWHVVVAVRRPRTRPRRRRRHLARARGHEGRSTRRGRAGRICRDGVAAMVDGSQQAGALRTVGRDLRAPRAAGVAGLAFAVLFISALLLVRGQPAAESTTDEIAAWYLRDGAKRVALVGLYLAPFAGIAFLWFIAVIRSHLGDREDQFFATVFLGSGLLFVAMLFAAAAAAGAPLAAVKFQGAPLPSPDAIGLARALAYTFLYVYGVRSAAVFMIAVSTIAYRTASLPRWLVVIGYVLAVVMLFSVSFFKIVVLLFPLWVAAVSLVILFTAQVPDAYPPSAAAPTRALPRVVVTACRAICRRRR